MLLRQYCRPFEGVTATGSVLASAKLGALVMPHTPQLLAHLREALAIADAANDHLIGAHSSAPIALLEARLAKPQGRPGPPA
jgi:hypothetical protein